MARKPEPPPPKPKPKPPVTVAPKPPVRVVAAEPPPPHVAPPPTVAAPAVTDARELASVSGTTTPNPPPKPKPKPPPKGKPKPPPKPKPKPPPKGKPKPPGGKPKPKPPKGKPPKPPKGKPPKPPKGKPPKPPKPKPPPPPPGTSTPPGWVAALLGELGAPDTADNQLTLVSWHVALTKPRRTEPLVPAKATRLTSSFAPAHDPPAKTLADGVKVMARALERPTWSGILGDLRDGHTNTATVAGRTDELLAWGLTQAELDVFQGHPGAGVGGGDVSGSAPASITRPWQDLLHVFARKIPATRAETKRRADALKGVFK